MTDKSIKRDTAWRNNQGHISVQKIFTNISIFISTFMAFGYVGYDAYNGVSFNELHAFVLLGTAILGMFFKHMSNKFLLKIKSFKLGPTGVEVDMCNKHNKEEEE